MRSSRFLSALIVVLGGMNPSTVPRDAGALSRVDHLIYATPDLEQTVEMLERQQLKRDCGPLCIHQTGVESLITPESMVHRVQHR